MRTHNSPDSVCVYASLYNTSTKSIYKHNMY